MAVASPSLPVLLKQQTFSQIQAQIIAFLQNPDPATGLPPLPAQSWASTSLATWFLKSESLMLASSSQGQVNIAMGGYFQLAADPSLQYTSGPLKGTSPWVDLGANQFFNQYRAQPTSTIMGATLTPASGVGPVTVSAGQLIMADSNGHSFTNLTGGVVPLAGSLPLTWLAQTPGSGSNLQISTPISLTTSLPGITVALSSIITGGTDLQSDQSLIAQCLNKWTAMGTGSPAGAMENWAYAASAEVRYAKTFPTGFGGIAVYVYGQGADVSLTGRTLVQNYMNSRLPQCGFLVPIVDPAVYPYVSPQNALPIPLVMSAVLWGPASAQAAAIATATTNLSTLVQSTPIGGYPIVAGTPDKFGISNSDLSAACLAPGVTKVVVTVNNPGIGPMQFADFFMPATGGVPAVAQAPGGLNPFSITYIAV